MPLVIPNESFETDLTGWMGYGGTTTLTRDNGVAAYDGTWQAKAVPTSVPNDYGMRSDVGAVPNPPQNAIYRARAALLGDIATAGELLAITLQEAGGSVGAQNGLSVFPSLGFSYGRSPWATRKIAQSDRTDAILYFILGAPSAGAAFYMDKVVFERVDTNPFEAAVIAAAGLPAAWYKLDDAAESDLIAVDLMGGQELVVGSTVVRETTPLANDGYSSMTFENSLGNNIFSGSTTLHAFTGNAPFTVACWLRLDAFNSGSGHWAVNKLQSADGWAIQCNADDQIEFFRAGNVVVYTNPGGPHVGNKLFCAIRYNGTTLKGNVEGVDVSAGVTSSGAIGSHVEPFCIGSYSGGGSGWDGPIDEVMVWNSDIGEAACLAIKNAGDFPPPGPAGPKLIVTQANRMNW